MEIRNPRLKFILICFFLASCWTRGGVAQSCLPCNQEECSLDATTCTHGVGKDVCGCCDECFKVPGEKCGGIHGICANGSRCYIKLEYGVSYIKFIQTPGVCEGIIMIGVLVTAFIQYL